jgi:hypothetical protein
MKLVTKIAILFSASIVLSAVVVKGSDEVCECIMSLVSLVSYLSFRMCCLWTRLTPLCITMRADKLMMSDNFSRVIVIPPLSWRIVWPICLFVKAIRCGRLVFDPQSISRLSC